MAPESLRPRPQRLPAPTVAAQQTAALNWPLLALIAMFPLQNIYLGKLPGLGAGLNFLNGMMLLALLGWKLRAPLAAPTPTPLHRPLYAYFLVFLLSVFYSQITLGSIPEGSFSALKDMFIPVLLYFIVLGSVRSRRAVIATVLATLLPLPYMFYVFRSQLGNVIRWHYDDDMRLVKGTFMELGSNEIGAFYAGYTLVLLGLCYFVRSLWVRAILGALALINLYCLLYSYSRGSWLSFLLGLAVMAWYASRKLAIAAVLGVALLSGSIMTVFPVSVQERFSTIFVEEEQRDNSAQSRWVLWGLAMEQYWKSPVVGIGFRTFARVNPLAKDTHNYYVKLLTEQGALGLGVFLVILWRAYRGALELLRRADDPLYRGLALGMLGCLAAFALGNMFGDRFSHYPLIAYFWVYLALIQRARLLCAPAPAPVPAPPGVAGRMVRA
ncbi:MAG TPA: O-antigen ligase family protein [Candidatus Competibacteraceae bacterium]|nr:O-antigen ligase family protein [Candidatus Competibacteraceae bacterium]